MSIIGDPNANAYCYTVLQLPEKYDKVMGMDRRTESNHEMDGGWDMVG